MTASAARHLFIAAGLLLVSALYEVAGAGEPALRYPDAQHGDVVDDYHGVRIPDPYRWLESLDAPILLLLETSSGHGGGRTLSQEIDQSASVYAFLADRLGLAVAR